MTDAEQRTLLTAMTGETDDGTLSAYLALAGDKVLRRAYPYDSSQTEVPARYAAVQVQIAAYLLNKRGAEGETAHSENGVARHYEDGDVPPSLMREILPFAATLGGEGT